MKNLESMLHFWNMAGMNGIQSTVSPILLEQLERKTLLNFFIGINLVGFLPD